MSLLRYLPNALTFARLSFAFPLAWWLWQDRVEAALVLLLVAGVTDLLDGYLAREFRWRTPSGSWLDPAADKVLITTALVTLTAKGGLPLWFCLLVIGKDVAMVLGVSSLFLHGIHVRIQPLLSGKLATVSQNVTLLVAMIGPLWPRAGQILPALLLVSALVTGAASVSYARTIALYRPKPAEGSRR